MKGAFNPKWVFPIDKPRVDILLIKPDEMFTSNWLDMMKSIGLDVSIILLFNRPPNFKHTTAHIDLKNDGSATAFGINTVFCKGEHEMAWYEMPAEKPVDVNFTNINTPYAIWPLDRLKKIDSCVIDRMTLVRVDQPHAIFVGDKERWCASLRINNPEVRSLSWNQVVERYQQFLHPR